MSSKTNTLIIDGNALFVRAFEINEKKILKNEEGASDLGAVYILLTSIRKRLQQFKPTETYITWDNPVFRGKHYRYELTNGLYKANRKPKSIKFYSLLDKAIELVKLMGVKTIRPYQLEADDVIAFLSLVSLKPCIIISGDNDLLQLLKIDGVNFYNIIKEVTINKSNILEYYPVTADQVVQYKAIMGDKGDNIEGIGGYGEVKAKRLCEDTSLINQLEPEKLEKIELNKKLVSFGYSLRCPQHKETEIPFFRRQLEDQKLLKPDFNTFFAKCEEYNFNDILKYKHKWMELQKQESLESVLLEALKD